MSRHESDDPPTSHVGAAALERARAAAKTAGEANERSGEAMSVAREALATARRLEVTLGTSPNPDLSVPGSGLCGGVANLRLAVELLTDKVDTLIEARRPSGEYPFRKLIPKGAVIALIVALGGGGGIAGIVHAMRGDTPAQVGKP